VIDGRRQITALHIAGDMCDLNSLVMPEADWALQALSPTAILRIPHAQMLEVARSYPNIAEAFWRDCSADASILSEWLINVGRRDARSRLAHLLCEMAIRLENAGLGNRREFRLQATQTQLGDALGLTPVHINRTVQTLRRMELATLRAHEVRILDWDRLAGLGDFDEDYLQMGVRDASRGSAFDRAGPQVANA
jgi:CRP-like cAMP-binding protein